MGQITETRLLNDYAGAINALKALETQHEALFARSLEVLRGLKSGDLSIDRIVVTDNGFEVMPEPPAIQKHPLGADSNGHGAAESIDPKAEAVA